MSGVSFSIDHPLRLEHTVGPACARCPTSICLLRYLLPLLSPRVPAVDQAALSGAELSVSSGRCSIFTKWATLAPASHSATVVLLHRFAARSMRSYSPTERCSCSLVLPNRIALPCVAERLCATLFSKSQCLTYLCQQRRPSSFVSMDDGLPYCHRRLRTPFELQDSIKRNQSQSLLWQPTKFL